MDTPGNLNVLKHSKPECTNYIGAALPIVRISWADAQLGNIHAISLTAAFHKLPAIHI
jgi:hypothetical protein